MADQNGCEIGQLACDYCDVVITNRTCQPTCLIEISCRRTSTLIHLSDHRIRQLTELARCIVHFEVWVVFVFFDTRFMVSTWKRRWRRNGSTYGVSA